MKTMLALLILATAAWAQDRPQDGDQPRPERPLGSDNPRPPGGREGERPRPPGAPREAPPPPRAPGAPLEPERPPMPRDGGRRPVPPFNPEELRAWLKDNEPETFRHLEQLQEDGRREEVQRMLAEASMRLRELTELKQRDPKAYEKMQELHRLEREGRELAEQARRAAPDDKESASKKLVENLSKQFDLREEQRVREIAELKHRVESLEKSLDERKAAKEKIVDKRRRELMGERIDDNW
ncbi:MAG TPA: hypothetical protein VKW04_23725 [Planctomycetota bacterium]|nr:hypothetical protein [Planctomycetota bacterium]